MLAQLGWRALASCSAAAVAFATAPAYAQVRYDFDLPAQPLSEALRAIGSKGRVNVLFDPAVVRGRQAPALRGAYPAKVALDQILRGSGLSARVSTGGAYIIEPEPRLQRVAVQVSPPQVLEPTVEPTRSSQPVAQEVEELIVTAQKREQRIDEIGLTVVAASAQRLKDAGVTNVAELTKIVPGLSVGTTGAGYPIFSLRGINFNANQYSAAPAVSTYIDEAPLPYSPLTGGVMFDLQRVEVVKGPQGTLFGQNATGGSINIIVAKPTADFRYGAELNANHFGQVSGEAFVSGPLSDTLRARLATSIAQGGAWQNGYYLTPGRKNGKQDRASVRFLLDWTPTEKLSVAFSLSAAFDKGDPQLLQVGGVRPIVPANAPAGLVGYPPATNNRDTEFDTNFDPEKDIRTIQSTLRLDYDLAENFKLTSITNYIDSDFRINRDADGTAIRILTFSAEAKAEIFSQEFRVSGDLGDGRVSYIGGVNFENDRLVDAPVVWMTFQNYSARPFGTSLDSIFKATNRSLGVFGNLDVKLTDTLTLTGGGRYTTTKQTVAGCTIARNDMTANLLFAAAANRLRTAAGLPTTQEFRAGSCTTINDLGPIRTYLPVFVQMKQKQDNWSWRGGLNFKPVEDTLLYALVSRGYKAGVFPVGVTYFASSIHPVSQEELTAYEAGFKAQFAEDRLRINGAVFWYDYVNKQFYTFIPSPTGVQSTLINIPKSKVKGFELEAVTTPFDGLTVSGAVTYTKSKVGNYSGFDLQLRQIDFTGKTFNFAPEWSAVGDIEYRNELWSGVTGYIGASLLYNSGTFSDLGQNPISRIKPFTTIDARLGFRTASGWRGSVWARNLTDAFYWTSVVPAPDVDGRTAGVPRTFGVTVGYAF